MIKQMIGRLFGGDLPELAKDPLGSFLRYSRHPDGMARVRIGPRRAFIVSDPAKIRQVMLENFEHYDKDTPAFRDVRLALGWGLLTSSGPFWKRQRRLAQPVFHGANLKTFAPIFDRLAAQCSDAWESACLAGQPVDATEDMIKLTFSAAAEALFGEDFSAQADEMNRVFPLVLKGVAGRTATPLPLPLWVPTAKNRELRQALASLKSIVTTMVQKRRDNLPQIAAQAPERLDLLSTFMLAKDEETGEVMSDQQLYDEAMTILIAGHETTANALAWAWVLLHRHPGEQERLRAEIFEATGGRPPGIDDLPRLPRLRMFFLETLRLYPPVWMFDRRAVVPTSLGETKIHPGNLVIMSPYAVHRLPSLWRDPEAFRPERFEPGNEEQKNKFAFLPFGAGPRICMGMGFAMIESQIILGTLLAKFRVRLADGDGIEPRTQVTLRTSRPVLLQLEKIAQSAP